MMGLASRPGTAVLPTCTVTWPTPASAASTWLRSPSNCRGHCGSYATTTAGMFTRPPSAITAGQPASSSACRRTRRITLHVELAHLPLRECPPVMVMPLAPINNQLVGAGCQGLRLRVATCGHRVGWSGTCGRNVKAHDWQHGPAGPPARREIGDHGAAQYDQNRTSRHDAGALAGTQPQPDGPGVAVRPMDDA